MSKIHVLAGDADGNNVTVIVHGNTPAGNNQAGVSWVNALIGCGMNHTTMIEGTGPGQITTAEKQAIEAGTVYEVHFLLYLKDPATGTPLTGAALTDELNTRAAAAVSNFQNVVTQQLRYFGYTQN